MKWLILTYVGLALLAAACKKDDKVSKARRETQQVTPRMKNDQPVKSKTQGAKTEIQGVQPKAQGVKPEVQQSLGQNTPSGEQLSSRGSSLGSSEETQGSSEERQEAMPSVSRSQNALQELNNLNRIINDMLHSALDQEREIMNKKKYGALKSEMTEAAQTTLAALPQEDPLRESLNQLITILKTKRKNYPKAWYDTIVDLQENINQIPGITPL